MAELSKTARASMGKTAGFDDPFKTNEQKIAELRKCRAAKLFVRPDFIDALVEEYDKEKAATLHLGEATASLLKRAETAEEELVIVKDKLRIEVEVNNELDRRDHERNLDEPSEEADASPVQDQIR
jgi:hypothetical protein